MRDIMCICIKNSIQKAVAHKAGKLCPGKFKNMKQLIFTSNTSPPHPEANTI